MIDHARMRSLLEDLDVLQTRNLELEARNRRLEDMIRSIVFQNVNLSVLLGDTHPPRNATHDQAARFYGNDPHSHRIWTCWRQIEKVSAMLEEG